MSEDLKNRLANSGKDGEEPMYQFFGDAPSLKRPMPKKEIDHAGNWSLYLDQLPLAKVGFVAILALLLIAALISGVTKHYSSAVGALLTMAGFAFGYQKVHITLPNEFEHYAGNLRVTLRAFLEQFPLIDKLIRNSNQVMALSILSIAVEEIIMRWFLFAPMAAFLYVVGVCGLGIGMICSIASGRIREAYRGVVTAFFVYLFMLLIGIIFTQTLSFILVFEMIILYAIALFFGKWLDNEMD